MARNDDDGQRIPCATPSGEDRRLANLLNLGAFGVGSELLGALYGGIFGRDLGTFGLGLTLVAAGTFALNLAYVQGRQRWRRWRR